MKKNVEDTGWVAGLLTWFAGNRRELPWRDEPTPYRVLVSEFMLQQTQVATVLPYFSRFLTAFPDVATLAAAPVDAVLKQWEGLGYYSRARHLHQCAQIIAREGFPQDPQMLSKLPGIGPYTAAAIASIAFNQPYPVVDGNVLRVRTRLLADSEVIDSTAAKKRHYESLLGVMAGVENPSEFNQAMMELGALVCHPRQPSCGACPLRAFCRSAAQGTQLEYPRRREKAAVPHYEVAVGVIYRGDEFLILRRSEEQMLGGLWEFPGGKLEAGETAAQAVVREVREETGLEVTVSREVAVVKHAYSHFHITMHAFACVLSGAESTPCTERPWHWIRREQLGDYAFPGANHKLFAAL